MACYKTHMSCFDAPSFLACRYQEAQLQEDLSRKFVKSLRFPHHLRSGGPRSWPACAFEVLSCRHRFAATSQRVVCFIRFVRSHLCHLPRSRRGTCCGALPGTAVIVLLKPTIYTIGVLLSTFIYRQACSLRHDFGLNSVRAV